MGKHKAKRFGNFRSHPVSNISEKDLDLDEGEDDGPNERGVPSAITNIIEKLQAPGTEERCCGCQLLASIVSQPKAIGYLLQENVVKIAAPLFLDSCIDVRKSALGALRNMSVFGQADVCDVMISNDVLTPLTALIKQYDAGWQPAKEATKYDTNTDVLVEAVELLSNLCASNSKAVSCFNKDGLLSTLLPLLKVDTYGHTLAIAVARCLHVVSENNSQVSAVCQQPEVVSELLSFINTSPGGVDDVLLRTLVTGILMNLPDTDLTVYYKVIVSTILEVLDMDVFPLIDAAPVESPSDVQEVSSESDMSWPQVDKLLNAQGLSLELLANLCSSDDEWEEMEDTSDDQSMEGSTEVMEETGETSNTLCLPSEISSVFVEKDILSKILQKALSLDAAQLSKLESSQCGKNTLRKLHDLRLRALLCLSNIVEEIDESVLSHSLPLMTAWSQLHTLATASQGSPSDEDMRWAITSAMRAVLQRMADTQPGQLTEVSEGDLDFLVNLAKDSKNRETQINVLRMISTFGCVLSLNTSPHPFLLKIGSILLEVACQHEELVVVAEALDSLFDVFKEDHTDPVVQQLGMVDKLKALQPVFKSKVSSQKKKLGDSYSMVMMAKSNLAGYIKYKQSHK